MTIDIQKAKRALATLQEEKRAQQDMLLLAAQAKQHLDQMIASRFLSGVEGPTQSLYKR